MTREEALEMYRVEHERFEGTRNMQWRFNIAFWTLAAVGIYMLRTQSFRMPWWHYLIAAGLFFVCHFMFIWQTQRSLNASRNINREIRNFLNCPDICFMKIDFQKFHDDNKRLIPGDFIWIAIQALATLILLLIGAYVGVEWKDVF